MCAYRRGEGIGGVCVCVCESGMSDPDGHAPACETVFCNYDHLPPKMRRRVCEIEAVVRPHVNRFHAIVQRDGDLTYRIIEYFCVHYARAHQVTYKNTHPDGNETIVDIARSYTTWRQCWKKNMFDVFQRVKKVQGDLSYRFHDQTFNTTVAQANFICWMITFEVDLFIRSHMSEIKEHKQIMCNRRRVRRRHQPPHEQRRQFMTPRRIPEPVQASTTTLKIVFDSTPPPNTHPNIIPSPSSNPSNLKAAADIISDHPAAADPDDDGGGATDFPDGPPHGVVAGGVHKNRGPSPGAAPTRPC